MRSIIAGRISQNETGGSGRIHTLASFLNDLLRFFLGLEEGLDVLRLAGLWVKLMLFES